MNAGRLCTREVQTARRELSVVDAAVRMRNAHVGDLVITKPRNGGEFPLGILTDRDIVVAGVATRSKDLAELNVGHIMTDVIVLVREEEDIESVLRTMRSNAVRRVPVIDDSDSLIGIVAYDDIVAYYAGELQNLARVVSNQQLTEERRRP